MANTEHQRYKETIDRILAIDKLPTYEEVLALIAFSAGNTSSGNLRLNEELFGFGETSIETLLISNRIYHADTVEFVDALVKTINKQGLAGKHIEIAAGKGKLSYWLRQRGIPITATDKTLGSEYVEELEATEAIKKYNPELILGCWLPKREEEALQKTALECETLRTYIDVIGYGKTDNSGWETFRHIRFRKNVEIVGRGKLPEYEVTSAKKVTKYSLPAIEIDNPNKYHCEDVLVWKKIK